MYNDLVRVLCRVCCASPVATLYSRTCHLVQMDGAHTRGEIQENGGLETILWGAYGRDISVGTRTSARRPQVVQHGQEGVPVLPPGPAQLRPAHWAVRLTMLDLATPTAWPVRRALQICACCIVLTSLVSRRRSREGLQGLQGLEVRQLSFAARAAL